MLLSLDFGTSSLKAAVMDEHGGMLHTEKAAYPLRMGEDDRVELLVGDVFGAFERVARAAFERYPGIEGICFDAFAPSMVLMDAEGEALTPVVTHMDRRSRAESRLIGKAVGADRYLQLTGVLPHAGGVTATTLFWFRRHAPALLDRACKMGHLTSYVFKQLTGEWGMDSVNASMTGLFETFGGDWSDEIAAALGIERRLLPDIREPYGAPGRLLGRVAARIGAREGLPVYMGTQDVAAAQVGAGNARAGEMLVTSGSSEMVSILCAAPTPHADYYVRRAATPGLFQVFSIGIGGFALEWFQRVFCSEMDADAFFGEYLVERLSLCDQPATEKFLPYLAGDRHSLVKKRGAFSGLTLGSSREDMLSALLWGIQQPVLNAMALCERMGVEIRKDACITGNLAEQSAYLDFKHRVHPGYQFRLIDNGPLRGNVQLGKR